MATAPVKFSTGKRLPLGGPWHGHQRAFTLARRVIASLAFAATLAACWSGADPSEADLSRAAAPDASADDLGSEPSGQAGGGSGRPLSREELLCKWDSCGGPLPDRTQPALDPEDR
jgi:hypothetical protein